MKKQFLIALFVVSLVAGLAQKTVKVQALKLKYALPDGWVAEVFAGEEPWEKAQSTYCNCAGILFTKQHSNGALKVMVYPSTVSGLDSTKRNRVGDLHFEKVEKYFKTTNKVFSFEKRVSVFTDVKKGKKACDAIRYMARPEKITYIIYTWQENNLAMDPKTERELFEMVNALEPMN